MITVYSFLPTITLNLGGFGATQNTPAMNERKITLHRGVLNKFQVKAYNADRKPVNLAQKEVYWRIIQLNFGAVAVGPATIMDQSKGIFVVQLNDRDLDSLPDGLYNMTFSIVNPEGDEEYFYTNLAGEVNVVVEIKEGMFMESTQANSTMRFSLYSDGWYYTDNFQPRPGNTGIHTVSYRMHGYSGQIKAEYTTDYSLSGAVWDTIQLEPGQNTVAFTGETQTIGYTFDNDIEWVRFAWKPDTPESGEVDKIIYRS
jgi:hypothetical protein